MGSEMLVGLIQDILEKAYFEFRDSPSTSKYWDNNVMGFYFGRESAPRDLSFYANGANADIFFNSKLVQTMSEVSDKVHSMNKKLIWMPYYGLVDQLPNLDKFKKTSTQSQLYASERVGWIVNQTDIFDTVLIQPNGYFYLEAYRNFAHVSECVNAQAWRFPVNGGYWTAGGTKTSKTTIGAVFEMDEQFSIFPNDNANANPGYSTTTASEKGYLINDYQNFFGGFIGNRPTSFYLGGNKGISSPDLITRFSQILKNK